MKKLLMTTAVLWSMLLCSFSQSATDLFISEYIEGSSNNKYIEVFNGTGQSIDLVDYQLKLFSNGATIASYSTDLSGTLGNGQVLVFKHTSAEIYMSAVTNSTACNFNGDDAIVLFRKSTGSNIDIFGCIGFDPGADWGVGANRTVDKTLVRKSTVVSGVSQNPTTGFPTLDSEWDMYAVDDVSSLGSHVFNPIISGLVDEKPTSTLMEVAMHGNQISISSVKNIAKVQLMAINGMELLRVEVDSKTEIVLPTMNAKSTIGVVVIEFEDGTIVRQKIIVR